MWYKQWRLLECVYGRSKREEMKIALCMLGFASALV